MSGFGYQNLQEENWPAWRNIPKSEVKVPPPTSSKSAVPDGATAETDSQLAVGFPRSKSWFSRPSSSKYHPMKPAAVRELTSQDVEKEVGGESQSGSLGGAGFSDKKSSSISKVHVLICGLLISCVVLVAFVVIYVFIILPADAGHEVVHDGMKQEGLVQGQSWGENTVKTRCGLLLGSTEQGVHVFKGIPYAVPPVGPLRWRPPIPRSPETEGCWEGVYRATEFGNKCVQPRVDNTSTVEGREDCLYLNVWTPSLQPRTHLPVMVWFHSGDFVYGSGHMPGMSPNAQTALATNSVLVSFNFRLGVFGFLALDLLREQPKGATGNYGFMDQQAALKWVQDNIGFFGGDVNQVTIFGHGSGATSIQAMLSSSLSSGLFHRAWLTSPVALLNKTVDVACKDNQVFLKTTGCTDAHCLRQLPPDQVSRSSPWPLQADWTLGRLLEAFIKGQHRNELPIFDGHVVHVSSQTSGPEGPVVPVILGSTYFGVSGMDTERTMVNITQQEYEHIMAQSLPGALGSNAFYKIRSTYGGSRDHTSPGDLPSAAGSELTHIVGDLTNVCPVRLMADNFLRQYSGSAPVYMYVLELYPSRGLSDDVLKKRFIGWDIAAFFDSFQDLGLGVGQGEINFQNVLREEIMTFIRSGHPGAMRWSTADISVGLINHDVTVTPEPAEEIGKCFLWSRYFHFFRYTWSGSAIY